MLIPLIYPVFAGLLAFFFTQFHPASVIDRFLEYRLSNKLQTYERRLKEEIASAVVQLVTSEFESRTILELPPLNHTPIAFIPQDVLQVAHSASEVTEPPSPSLWGTAYVTAFKETLRDSLDLAFLDRTLDVLALADGLICLCLVIASLFTLRWLFSFACPTNEFLEAEIDQPPASPDQRASRTPIPNDMGQEPLLILRQGGQSRNVNNGVAPVEAQISLPFATSYQIIVSPSIPSAVSSPLLLSPSRPLPLPSLSAREPDNTMAIEGDLPTLLVTGDVENTVPGPSVCASCASCVLDATSEKPAPPTQSSVTSTPSLSPGPENLGQGSKTAHTIEGVSGTKRSPGARELGLVDPSAIKPTSLLLDSSVEQEPLSALAREDLAHQSSCADGDSKKFSDEIHSSVEQPLDVVKGCSKVLIESLSSDSTTLFLADSPPASIDDLGSHSSGAGCRCGHLSNDNGSSVGQGLDLVGHHLSMSLVFPRDPRSFEKSRAPDSLTVDCGSSSTGKFDHPCDKDNSTIAQDLDLVNRNSPINLETSLYATADVPAASFSGDEHDILYSGCTSSDMCAVVSGPGLEVETPTSSAGSHPSVLQVDEDSATKIENPRSSTTPARVPSWGRRPQLETMAPPRQQAMNRSSTSSVIGARNRAYAPYLDRRPEAQGSWRRPLSSYRTPDTSRT